MRRGFQEGLFIPKEGVFLCVLTSFFVFCFRYGCVVLWFFIYLFVGVLIYVCGCIFMCVYTCMCGCAYLYVWVDVYMYVWVCSSICVLKPKAGDQCLPDTHTFWDRVSGSGACYLSCTDWSANPWYLPVSIPTWRCWGTPPFTGSGGSSQVLKLSWKVLSSGTICPAPVFPRLRKQ